MIATAVRVALRQDFAEERDHADRGRGGEKAPTVERECGINEIAFHP